MNELFCLQNNQYYYTKTKYLVSPLRVRDNFYIQQYHGYTIHLHKKTENKVNKSWRKIYLVSNSLRMHYYNKFMHMFIRYGIFLIYCNDKSCNREWYCILQTRQRYIAFILSLHHFIGNKKCTIANTWLHSLRKALLYTCITLFTINFFFFSSNISSK